MMNDEWEERYIDEIIDVGYDYMFKNAKQRTMESVYTKYYEHIPKTIFKFQAASKDYVYDDIANDKIALVKIKLFNDPFDSLLSTGFSDLNNFDQYRVGEERYINDIKDFRSMMYVCCFTSNLHSIPMWSYYGENHKGICIEYKVKDLNKLTPFNVLPVLYKKERKKLINSQGEYGVINQTDFAKMLYIKSDQWKHEAEWRIVGESKITDDIYKTPIKSIVSVYLGCKMDDDTKQKYIRLCKNKKINCYQMKMTNDSFSLEYEKISV